MSRFAQADTIIPSTQGVQGYDRYAYVNNSPVNYKDPTGHWCEPGDYKPGGYCWSPSVTDYLSQYGIVTNNATPAQNQNTLQAAQFAGNKIADTIGGGISSQQAFLSAHGNISITFGANTDYCETDDHAITCGTTELSWLVQTLIHEFGHVFDNQFKAIGGTGRLASDYPDSSWNLTYEGYKDDYYPSMQHPAKDSIYGTRGPIEDFADMYLNWVLDINPVYPNNGFTNEGMGNDRRHMMDNTFVNIDLPRGMPVWLHLMGLR